MYTTANNISYHILVSHARNSRSPTLFSKFKKISMLKRVVYQLISYCFVLGVDIGTSRFNQHFISHNKIQNVIHKNNEVNVLFSMGYFY